jgi:hypothetical protein
VPERHPQPRRRTSQRDIDVRPWPQWRPKQARGANFRKVEETGKGYQKVLNDFGSRFGNKMTNILAYFDHVLVAHRDLPTE